LRKSFAADATKNIVAAARNTLGIRYDFRHTSDYPQIYIIKKYKSEADFEKSFEKAKELFEKNTAITPASETKEKMAPYLEIWAKQGSINPKGDKKLKRIYQAANYNLAITYFYLDEFDNAKQHAELVIKSEEKDKRCERLLERIEKTKKLMELHGVHTLHYERDLSDAMAPKQVKAFEEEKEELEADNNSLGGTITMNGEQINGSVLQSKGAEQMFFGEKGSTSFMVEADGKMTEYDLTSDEVSAFTIGERKFVKMNFSPCAKGKEEASLHILEEIYTSEKINLYQYYPSTGVLGDEKTEFAFQKTGEESPTSLLDTQFLLWNKGIAKYFSSCSDLEGMCAAGDIKMNKDDLLKAGRIYSELCE
jgi:tetratricopeptide (TPR) repeat protein